MPKTEEPEVIDAEAVEEKPATQELAIAIREEQAVAVQPQTYLPTPREWEAMTAMAVRLCNTAFVPESYRGKPDTVLAAIATGREMGIGPMQSLRDIHMIDGRPAFSAQLMLSKMRAGGVVIVASEATNDHAKIKARREDTGEEGTFEFTKADAEAANLLGKKNWRSWPQDMYWARAVGRMARRFGSDLLGGLVYAKEELDDIDDYEGGYDVGGAGYAAEIADPGRGLLPGAVQGSDGAAVAALDAQMKALNAHVDWRALIGKCVQAQYGVDDRANLKPAQRDDWWLRLRNAIAKLAEVAGDFGGELAASPAQVQAAFAWAFPSFGDDIPLLDADAAAEVGPSETEPENDADVEPPVLTDEQTAALEQEAREIPFPDEQ